MRPRLLPEPLRLAAGPLLRLQSDERLVRLVRAGSHPAFAEIVHRYRPGLVRYTNRLVGSARGEDVVQQGLAGAHTALMADGRRIDVKPWLFRIVHNAALNVLRADREIGVLEDHADELVALSVETEVASRERFRETVRAVQALPPAQRDALLLRELEGRSHEEIAVALGVSAGAARQHLMRARVTMRAAVSAITPFPFMLQLAAAGGAVTAGAPVAGAGAGFGLGKLGAGLLAAGAVAGGAGVAVPAIVSDAGPAQVRRAEPRSDAPGATAGSSDRTLAGGGRLDMVAAAGGAGLGSASSIDDPEHLRAGTIGSRDRTAPGGRRAGKLVARDPRAGASEHDEDDGRVGDLDDRSGEEDDAHHDAPARHGTGAQEKDDDGRSASAGSGGDDETTRDATAGSSGSDAQGADASDFDPVGPDAGRSDRDSGESVRAPSASTPATVIAPGDLERSRSVEGPDDGADMASGDETPPAAP